MESGLNKTVLGIGYKGVGKHLSCKNGKKTKEYVLWKNMLHRCYSGKYKAYKMTSVCEEWYNFQNFAEWCNLQPEFFNEKSCLDKDILKKGNRVYCPEFCCFVPNEINIALASRRSLRGGCPLGVCFDKSRGKYHSCLNKFKVQINLGRFNTPEEAFNVYKIAKEEYLKELAVSFKKSISDRVYEALLKYEVEVTD